MQRVDQAVERRFALVEVEVPDAGVRVAEPVHFEYQAKLQLHHCRPIKPLYSFVVQPYIVEIKLASKTYPNYNATVFQFFCWSRQVFLSFILLLPC